MCGVFGFVSKGPMPGELFKLISNIFYETEVRGPHASGYAHFGKNRKIISDKAPVKASEYIQTPAWTRVMERTPSVLIGHTRHATAGDPADNRNNHPHVGRRLAVVHNGTLKKYEYRPWAEICKTECDSEAILRVMELGSSPEMAVSRVFNCFYDSAFSCLTLDKADGRMRFFRNTGRPLRVWKFEGFLLIGSNEKILDDAFYMTYGINSDSVEGIEKWSPVPGTLYTVDKDLNVTRRQLFDFSDYDSGYQDTLGYSKWGGADLGAMAATGDLPKGATASHGSSYGDQCVNPKVAQYGHYTRNLSGGGYTQKTAKGKVKSRPKLKKEAKNDQEKKKGETKPLVTSIRKSDRGSGSIKVKSTTITCQSCKEKCVVSAERAKGIKDYRCPECVASKKEREKEAKAKAKAEARGKKTKLPAPMSTKNDGRVRPNGGYLK